MPKPTLASKDRKIKDLIRENNKLIKERDEAYAMAAFTEQKLNISEHDRRVREDNFKRQLQEQHRRIAALRERVTSLEDTIRLLLLTETEHEAILSNPSHTNNHVKTDG